MSLFYYIEGLTIGWGRGEGLKKFLYCPRLKKCSKRFGAQWETWKKIPETKKKQFLKKLQKSYSNNTTFQKYWKYRKTGKYL